LPVSKYVVSSACSALPKARPNFEQLVLQRYGRVSLNALSPVSFVDMAKLNRDGVDD
jgi:hypothetical protein